MNQKVNLNSMRCAAFHEAGHAVACVLQDLPFVKVFVVYREDETKECDLLGRVVRNVDKPSFAGRLEEAKLEIIVAYAGPIAETLAHPGLPLILKNSPDYFDAISLLKFTLCKIIATQNNSAQFDNAEFASHLSTVNSTIEECYQKAVKLIRENSKTVERLANELLSRRELTRDEVIQICNGPS